MSIESKSVTPDLEYQGSDEKKNAYWKYVGAILIFGTLALECANVTLSSKCATHSEATSSLRSFLNALSEKSFTLADMTFDVKDSVIQRNGTVAVCKPQREFPLETSDKRVNVCTYGGGVRVDVRQFISNRATLKGIFFDVREFLSLSEILPAIQAEVMRQLEALTI